MSFGLSSVDLTTLGQLPARRLTKLYLDTKHSCDVVTEQEKVADVPELNALHRKFRIQKDRLIAWGLEWGDQSAAVQGSIDESVARAGLTEIVTSVLNNIKDVLNEAERIRCSETSAAVGDLPWGKSKSTDSNDIRWSPSDRIRYEDLCRDLTTSIDTLYDLSRSRRAFQEGTYPSHAREKASVEPLVTAVPQSTFLGNNYSASEETLVNPSRISTVKTSSGLGLPPKLEPESLILPEEEPPPYHSVGSTSSRMIGHLHTAHVSTNPWKSVMSKTATVPVLIEYATFDPIYRDTGVSPPLGRLEGLLAYFSRCDPVADVTPSGTLKCLGYFEDPKQPRFGLVYELPRFVYNGPVDAHRREDLKPATLYDLLQAASKSSNVTDASLHMTPALEVRFRLALEIARTFSRLHMDEQVHKDINSGNIIVFHNPSATLPLGRGVSRVSKYDLRAPYICSFDMFSEYNVEAVPTTPLHNVYRHPDDPQAGNPACGIYGVQYDLYSLGLVLLEVGMWLPISDIFKSKYSLSDFKLRLQDIWTRKLQSRCGTSYMEVVRDCLCAADQWPSSSESGQLSHELYSQIIPRLETCCLLDATDYSRTQDTAASFRRPPGRQKAQQGRSASVSDLPGCQDSQSRTDTRRQSQMSLGSDVRKAQQSASLPSTLSLVATPIATRHKASTRLVRRSKPLPPTEVSEEPLAGQQPYTEDLTRYLSPDSLLSYNTIGEADSESVTSVASRYKMAASTIQRAWRSRRDKLSFQDYRRKVTIIQNQWRKRAERQPSKPSSPFTSQRGDGRGPKDAMIESSVQERTILEEAPIYIHPFEKSARPKLRLQPVKLPSEVLDHWHDKMLPRLERVTARALRESSETVSIDLLSVGDTTATARPTIFITCSSTGKIKAVLSRKFTYDQSVFDLKVRQGKVRRSKVSKPRRRKQAPHRSTANGSNGGTYMPPLNPFHQQRPLCGASIGAYRGEHLPPVSYGGVVLVDGEPYGMSVHHLLDSPSEDDDSEFGEEEPTRSSAPAKRNSWLAGVGSQPTLEVYPEAMFPFEISDDDDEGTTNDADYDSLSDLLSDSGSDSDIETDTSTQGDLVGIEPGEGSDILVTQPALDDVGEDFFPSEEDRDEDHLDSHRLGHVHASSGIRRWTRNGVVHEIDWALLKLEETRLQPFNLIQGGKRFRGADGAPTMCPKLLEPVCRQLYGANEDEYPCQVAKAEELGGLKVHCFARTSGLQGGVVGMAMSSVRIYRRRSFSRSWHVVGNFGGTFTRHHIPKSLVVLIAVS